MPFIAGERLSKRFPVQTGQTNIRNHISPAAAGNVVETFRGRARGKCKLQINQSKLH